MTAVFSMVYSGRYAQAHLGRICQVAMALMQPATIGSAAGQNLAFGIELWTRLQKAYDGDVRMIDGTSVPVHHSAATLKKATQIEILDEAGVVLLQKSML